MAKTLVTGGAGFIGSHIVDALLARGDEVVIYDNLSTGRKDNIAQHKNATFVEGCITNSERLAAALSGVEYVFHQAALASVPLSVERPLDTNLHCVTGTLNVLNEARKAEVKRVVYAASSSAYGDQPFLAKRETDLPAPLSPYAVAKLAGEYYCQAFFHTYGLETVGLRYFNVFGPRQDPDSPYSAVIPIFLTLLLQGKQPVVYGDGEQSRDFTFVKNIVNANLTAATAADVAGKVINVANGKSTSLLTLLKLLNEQLGTDIQPKHDPPRAGDVRDSMADNTLATSLLKYEIEVDFEEGLKRSVEYYRQVALQRS
ncbi:SDR family oxidoreductase [Blastopirellula marina]|uniref:LPS biosynthesis protein WbpP n=1 Tax=Blastopirellula marina TaxID=124 RepID=A0A2S8FPB4_9BACT|nr:SDR family oxidoreductase [Blastopirellula marina]PQO34019.1 LPS biosynthesis protein WbpP [Blastopirellula marina]PTL43805.1 LPS biosynthesis protein WbpP [Blastopirellula marina]